MNSQPWGVFLAIEEPEESFARRNFGPDHGQLYKPDYRSLNAENADVALRYIDDDPSSYPNLFENAKFDVDAGDQARLIEALQVLSTGEDLETAVDVDEVLRYFTVQVFVLNWDSYLGHTGHNYFLYEEDGVLSILPWDYNLAFGTYALGMTDPIRNPTEYFESGRYEAVIRETQSLIAPYVEADPTAFCSYTDHLLAVDTLLEVCRLRAESIRGQLNGDYPATLAQQAEHLGRG